MVRLSWLTFWGRLTKHLSVALIFRIDLAQPQQFGKMVFWIHYAKMGQNAFKKSDHKCFHFSHVFFWSLYFY